MIVTKPILERKVNLLNDWLQNHPRTHVAYNRKIQNRNYYVNRLCDMDELEVETIKI